VFMISLLRGYVFGRSRVKIPAVMGGSPNSGANLRS
jgi:hypothetical protein